jgi:hypothetical protein
MPLFTFLHNLLNALAQIASKMELYKTVIQHFPVLHHALIIQLMALRSAWKGIFKNEQGRERRIYLYTQRALRSHKHTFIYSL